MGKWDRTGKSISFVLPRVPKRCVRRSVLILRDERRHRWETDSSQTLRVMEIQTDRNYGNTSIPIIPDMGWGYSELFPCVLCPITNGKTSNNYDDEYKSRLATSQGTWYRNIQSHTTFHRGFLAIHFAKVKWCLLVSNTVRECRMWLFSMILCMTFRYSQQSEWIID